jgi:hypothetical protein
MGPPSYMRSVIDRNVHMRRIPALWRSSAISRYAVSQCWYTRQYSVHLEAACVVIFSISGSKCYGMLSRVEGQIITEMSRERRALFFRV